MKKTPISALFSPFGTALFIPGNRSFRRPGGPSLVPFKSDRREPRKTPSRGPKRRGRAVCGRVQSKPKHRPKGGTIGPSGPNFPNSTALFPVFDRAYID